MTTNKAHTASQPEIELSVLVPVMNEAGNIAPLVEEICAAFAGRSFEIIYVDDASNDASPAELAFVRADQIDLAISVWALSLVDDLDRVFRQVHRCVRAGGHVVVAVPHPITLTTDPADDSRIVRSWKTTEAIGERHVHTAEDIVTAFTRTNFAVDVLLERHNGGPTPVTLLARARRLGA